MELKNKEILVISIFSFLMVGSMVSASNYVIGDMIYLNDHLSENKKIENLFDGLRNTIYNWYGKQGFGDRRADISVLYNHIDRYEEELKEGTSIRNDVWELKRIIYYWNIRSPMINKKLDIRELFEWLDKYEKSHRDKGVIYLN